LVAGPPSPPYSPRQTGTPNGGGPKEQGAEPATVSTIPVAAAILRMRDFSNPIPATAEIDISCTVDGDTRWSGNPGMSRWPSVATVCGRACTCDSRDDPG